MQVWNVLKHETRRVKFENVCEKLKTNDKCLLKQILA